jgi:type VI secretion system lysozyme-like protein
MEPRTIRGARTPLFERIASSESPGRVLDRAALERSAAASVAALLNTRCHTHKLGEEPPGGPEDYGIPDFSSVSAASESARALLASVIAKKIARFEPRLANVAVTLERDPHNPGRLRGAIRANLADFAMSEPVVFELAGSPEGVRLV